MISVRWYLLWYLLLAVLLTTVLACITQSGFNLAAIAALTGGVAAGDIAATIWFDLTHFGFTYAPIALVNLLVAAVLLHFLPLLRRYWLAAGLGAVLLYLMLLIINIIAPMPTLIAATRSNTGIISMLLCSSAGMLSYVWLLKRRKLYA
ncbi:hypothetical protein SAMN05660691_02945 [Rheinheimera pacifica]|uniref:Uncharacterized protein n=1 Tax=Rheinheimera pacifica TaxID=173990 RepID=A0A1H6MUD5_9GAMM|nr:hypothetical protein [Rheinheimera pacifica]SEI03216.1 hypothetical protein SAMN05660691_02945 [Rheinheimera pacifica]